MPAEPRRGVAAFLRDTRGGAMLISGGFMIGMLATVGSVMASYSWREAQLAELDGALRASVSATAMLLGGAGGTLKTAIEDRVEDVLTALVDGIEIDGVTVVHDQATSITEITVAGRVAYEGIWGQPGGYIDRDRTVRVQFDTRRYEVALALDLSVSMTIPFGSAGTRLDGLKEAIRKVAAIMQGANAATPGTAMVSIVPFASTVNVADTSGSGQTAAKERYVRMLVGPADTTGELLERARQQAADGKGGHWVDTFHHYGVGEDMGPLLRRFLPEDLRDGNDWNLRRIDVDVDVSSEVPDLGTWTVKDVDFWNGCVMARWGAYWNADARGASWSETDTANWPASSRVAAWSSDGKGLPDTPLHLSDAPPSAADPNTLFTAYSWPDARIGGTAAARLQTVMNEVLDGTGDARQAAYVSDNDWTLADGGGDRLCMPSAIVPLTDDIAEVTAGVDSLQATGHMTYLNLGMVWALRTLSPLWRSVWDVVDIENRSRPTVLCASGETQNCADRLEKIILLVSDGRNFAEVVQGPVRDPSGRFNPALSNDRFCVPPHTRGQRGPNYIAAWKQDTAADFNASFGGRVDSSGKFTGAAVGDVVDELMRFSDTLPAGQARGTNLQQRLVDKDTTPWKLFRGLDAEFNDFLMDAGNEFGFDGRPIHPNRGICSYQSVFSPYGRTEDLVQVGGAPVSGVAPFADAKPAVPTGHNYGKALVSQLVDWFVEACEVAGRRGVRVEAIFIGDRTSTKAIADLEECVDAAGGDPKQNEVLVAPDAAALEDAFVDVFVARRNVRFLN